MEMFQKVLKGVKNPSLIVLRIWISNARLIKSDKLYLNVLYFLRTGKKMSFDNPKSFSQKMQWLKINKNNTPICTKMVDKYEVRELIKEKIGEEYLIPLYGVWNDFDEIDFKKLPSQFVLKTTHDSGTVIICEDKSKLDIHLVKKKINKSLNNNNFFWKGREYTYKNVKPRIIAEKLMVNNDGSNIMDFKFFNFHGKAKFILVDTDKLQDHKHSFHDLNMKLLPFYCGKNKQNNVIVDKPEKLDEMVRISEILSKDFSFLRVDLYNINNQIYFGELTFHHNGGTVLFSPYEWDLKIGDLIKLK